ncbi:MAG: class I SAM-dependent methyltransferase [Isosphaeraceae bacterium]
MLKRLRLPSKARIIDLGGSEFVWKLVDHDYHVTLVNLPGFNPAPSDPDRFTTVSADACHLRDLFDDMSYDAVYSNSTIEHVGDESRQSLFAEEVRRLAPAYWVQTPSTRFPLEIHTGVPFYWSLPEKMRQRMLQRWHRRMPAWTEMIMETRVLSRKRMESLFPDAEVYIERKLGLEKSYSFYRPHPGLEGRSQGENGEFCTKNDRPQYR